MRDLGIGLVGLGRLGMVHAANIATGIPEAALVAVCDLRSDLAAEVARKTGATPYADYRDMLRREDVNAVVVVTPSGQHRQPVIDAAQAGKHVFCEKPMAATAQDSADMIKAIRAAGISFQIGYMRRFDPAYAEAKALLDAGRIGKPVMFKATSRDPFPPPAWALNPLTGGGLYIDMHSHDFDLARWLMGDSVEYVSVEQSRLVFQDIDAPDFADNTVVNLRFRNGAIGNVDGSYNACYGYDVRTEVLGSQGAVFIGELKYRAVTLAKADHGVTSVSTFKTDQVPHFMKRFNEAYTAELRHFVLSLLDGKRPSPDETDGHAALQVALACHEAVRTGRRARVDEGA